MEHRPYIIAIESCPGGGKGFLLKHLAQYGLHPYKVAVLLQDDSIQHVMDYNKDPKRWNLTKELHFLLRHVQQISDACKMTDVDVIFIEGSPVTDCHGFFLQSPRTASEEGLYHEWFRLLQPRWHIDAHVLLSSSPHEHLERIIGNSKKEQSHTTIVSVHNQMKVFYNLLRHTHMLSCHPNFEDNEPAMEIMKSHLRDIVQILKNKSLFTFKNSE